MRIALSGVVVTLLLAGCQSNRGGGAVIPTVPAIDPPAQIIPISATSQTAPAGTAVSIWPVVKVTDSAGNGVSGVAVTFSVSSGRGSVSNVGTYTDGDGEVSAQTWVVALGDNALTASVSGVTQTTSFHAEGISPVGCHCWTIVDSMVTGRSFFGAAALDGILYAVGGQGAGFGSLDAVEGFDPATGIWTPRAPMPTPRWAFGIGVVNDILYALGGADSTVEAYDPSTNSWISKAPMPIGLDEPAVGTVNGLLYAVGAPLNDTTATVEAYDPATDHWMIKAPFPAALDVISLGAMHGVLYAVARSSQAIGSSIYAYDPGTDRWTSKGPAPALQRGQNVAVIDDILYLVNVDLSGGSIGGGFGPFDGRVALRNDNGGFWAFDAVTGQITSLRTMPTPRVFAAVAALHGGLYVLGGGTSIFSQGSRTVEAYWP